MPALHLGIARPDHRARVVEATCPAVATQRPRPITAWL